MKLIISLSCLLLVSSCFVPELKHNSVIVNDGVALNISIQEIIGRPRGLSITLNGENYGKITETKSEDRLAISGKMYYTDLNTKFGVFTIVEERNLNLLGIDPQFRFECYLDGKFAGTVDGPQ